MLWFHKKSFSLQHFLELKFIYQLGQTRIHIIISFLSMIRYHKLIPRIGVNEIEALVSFKKICSHHFLESKFICQLGQTRIHIIITFLFMIGYHKLIFLIGINDIDDQFHKKSLSFTFFLQLKFVCQLGQTRIHIMISFLLEFGHHKLILLFGINDIDAWVS